MFRRNACFSQCLIRSSALKCTFVFLLMLFFCNAAHAVSPWPLYQHDLQNTGRTTIRAATSTPILAWRFGLKYRTVSSVIIGDDGTLYTGSGSGDRHCYALNPDGTLKWKYLTENAVFITAVGSDGTVYCSSDKVYALEDRGQDDVVEKWHFHVTSPPDRLNNTLTLIENQDIIIVKALWSDKLYGIRASDGQQLWQVSSAPIRSGMASGVSFDEKTVYVTGMNTGIAAFKVQDGTKLWEFPADAPPDSYIRPWSAPTIGPDGTIYTAGIGKFYALEDLGTSVGIKWEKDVLGWAGYGPSCLDDNNVYVTGVYGTGIYAFRKNDGIELWHKPADFIDFGNSLGCIIDGNGNVLVGTNEYFYALNPSTGDVVWSYSPPGANNFVATPSIDNEGNIYQAADSSIYAYTTKVMSIDSVDPEEVLSDDSYNITITGYFPSPPYEAQLRHFTPAGDFITNPSPQTAHVPCDFFSTSTIRCAFNFIGSVAGKWDVVVFGASSVTLPNAITVLAAGGVDLEVIKTGSPLAASGITPTDFIEFCNWGEERTVPGFTWLQDSLPTPPTPVNGVRFINGPINCEHEGIGIDCGVLFNLGNLHDK